MFGLKHQNLVEIYGVLPGPVTGLIMRRYSSNLLEVFAPEKRALYVSSLYCVQRRCLLSHQERLKVVRRCRNISEYSIDVALTVV